MLSNSLICYNILLIPCSRKKYPPCHLFARECKCISKAKLICYDIYCIKSSKCFIFQPPLIKPTDDQLTLADIDTIKVIGKGNGGVVQLVQHKWTGQFFALKVIYSMSVDVLSLYTTLINLVEK